jgi:hypothetical protein
MSLVRNIIPNILTNLVTDFIPSDGLGALFTLPSEFTALWNPDFNIYENGRTYSTDFDFDALKPTGTTYYATKTGNDTTGDGSVGNPYRTLQKAWDEGADIVMVGDGVWDRVDGFTAGFNPTRDFAIQAVNKGKAILTRAQPSLSWTQQGSPNTDVYTSTRSSVGRVLDLTATGRAGEFLKDGTTPVPIPLTKVANLAECQALAGSWYQSGSTVGIHTHNNRTPDSSVIVSLIENIWTANNDVTIWMDGIEGWGDSAARHELSANNTAIWAWRDCAARYVDASVQNGLIIQGVNETYSIRCDTTDIISGDGFNYKNTAGATNPPKGLEVDCKAIRCGKDTATNFNGSTAHDNCLVIRLNGDYSETFGPVIADVGDAKTVSLGVVSGDSLLTDNTGSDTAFQTGDDGLLINAVTWLKNCTANGANYARYAAGSGTIYDYGGFIDNTTLGDGGNAVIPYPAAPVITGVPTIAGTAQVGETLTATPASATGLPTPTRTWQWYRNTTAISGATSITYDVVEADVGFTLKVAQIDTNIAGVDSAESDPTATVTAVPSFDPNGADLVIWFDMTDTSTIVNDSGRATSITDKKSGEVLSQTGTNRPFTGSRTMGTNSRNVLDFQGGNYLNNATISIDQPSTVFFVFKGDRIGVSEFLSDSLGTGRQAVIRNTSNNNSYFAGASLAVTSTTDDTVMAVVVNGASSEIYINGSSVITGNVSTNNLRGLFLGSNNAAGLTFDGAIGQYRHYDRILTSDEIDDVYDYINTHFGF